MKPIMPIWKHFFEWVEECRVWENNGYPPSLVFPNYFLPNFSFFQCTFYSPSGMKMKCGGQLLTSLEKGDQILPPLTH